MHRSFVLGVVALALLPSAAGYLGANAGSVRRVRTAVMSAPAQLAEAAWLPELQACCAVSDAAGPEEASPQRMGAVLEWLQKMLVELELGNTEELDGEEEDELDDDFVSAARPWLHTKAFHDISADDFAEQLWGHVTAANYLLPNGEGGSLLLLLPSRLPLSLFEKVTSTMSSSVAAELNSAVVVSGFHADAEQAKNRSPVPVIQLFLDSPDLLVDGGSMSDAASFL